MVTFVLVNNGRGVWYLDVDGPMGQLRRYTIYQTDREGILKATATALNLIKGVAAVDGKDLTVVFVDYPNSAVQSYAIDQARERGWKVKSGYKRYQDWGTYDLRWI